jgi:hypothetical protein
LRFWVGFLTLQKEGMKGGRERKREGGREGERKGGRLRGREGKETQNIINCTLEIRVLL